MEQHNKQHPQITVTVDSNQSNCGKTIVTALIAETLVEHGFTDVVVVSQDGDFPQISNRAVKLRDVGELPQPSVTVLDTNGHDIGTEAMTFKVGKTSPKE